MATVEEQMAALVEALTKKAAANQIIWREPAEGRFSVDLPVGRVMLEKSPGEEDAVPDVMFRVDSPNGAVVYCVQVKANQPNYEQVKGLIQNAQSYTSSAGQFLESITEFLSKSNEVGEPLGEHIVVPASPPPPPQRPSEEQAQQLFKTIAGKWHLEYPRGSEDLEIDEGGNYFLLTLARGEPVARSARPRFRLVLNHCDETLTHIELSKQLLNGKVRQNEVLNVSERSMKGFAKHDEHSLVYTRM